MNDANSFRWTNKSVLALAGGEDPIVAIERKARDLVLHARDQGWNGPPFNPIFIADLLKIPITANASVADACIVATDVKLQIQFNPTQVRERVPSPLLREIRIGPPYGDIRLSCATRQRCIFVRRHWIHKPWN